MVHRGAAEASSLAMSTCSGPTATAAWKASGRRSTAPAARNRRTTSHGSRPGLGPGRGSASPPGSSMPPAGDAAAAMASIAPARAFICSPRALSCGAPRCPLCAWPSSVRQEPAGRAAPVDRARQPTPMLPPGDPELAARRGSSLPPWGRDLVHRLAPCRLPVGVSAAYLPDLCCARSACCCNAAVRSWVASSGRAGVMVWPPARRRPGRSCPGAGCRSTGSCRAW
jgi:hypothetical protein